MRESESCGPPAGRCRQLRRLELLFGPPDHPAALPECIFAYGLAATGKTRVVSWFLKSRGIAHATFHCVELYSPRLCFESILCQLSGVSSKCEQISDFVSIMKRDLDPSKVFVILLEHADRLRDAEPQFRQVFCRLQELTGLNVTCILESRLDWSKFRPSRDIPNPVLLHFPQYSKDELTTIMSSQLSNQMGLDMRRDYVSLVLSVFYSVARSVEEMSHIAQLHFPEYCRPIAAGECTERDTQKLWFNIEKPLKKCLSTVHLREVASQQMVELQKVREEEEEKEKTDTLSIATLNSMMSSSSSSRVAVELPFYSKFLLIAAYLASYNPQRTDKRFFVKHHGKQRKTAQMVKAKERLNSQLTGPKPFPLERMLAIFYNIVEEKVSPTANIYSQITSLVRLQLLTTVGLEQIDQPKYKCNVTLEFVKHVGRTVQFEVMKYLWDLT